MKFNLFLAIALYLCGFVYTQDPYCQPVSPAIDPNLLPKLPNQFQVRVEINSITKNRNTDALIIYDFPEKKAEIVYYDNDGSSKQVFFYDKNELFYISENNCNVKPINESGEIIFGFILESGGFNMKPPSNVFHFNNGQAFTKLEQTEWRGIKVNHYKSCQKWTEINTIATVDYYFKVSEHQQAVIYDNQFNEIPIAMVVEGLENSGIPNTQPEKVKIEYNFYEFRTAIERRADLFGLPRGLFCQGNLYKMPIPKLSDSFSFDEEIIVAANNQASFVKAHYSYKLKATSFNLPDSKTRSFQKYIQDFNSGIGYNIDKDTGKCEIYSLGTRSIDRNDETVVQTQYGSFIDLKTPEGLFYIDDSYYYAGERYERGVLSRVWTSNRSDIANQNSNVTYFINEIYMRKFSQLEERAIPISIHATFPQVNLRTIGHIYNFESGFDRDQYDLNQCFQGNDKINFAIRFEYPRGVDQYSFENFYGERLKEVFDKTILEILQVFNSSPLRITKPRFEPLREGFLVYAGLVNYAPAKYHYRKTSDRPRVDVNKGQMYITDSPSSCAEIALRDSIYDAFNTKYMSFDYCPLANGNFGCLLYNYTTTTYANVLSDTGVECDHYIKIVQKFDGARVDELFRTVEEQVVRNSFNLNINDNSGQPILSFPSRDIFKVAESELTGSGTSSFFKQFILLTPDTDFNETEIMKNSSLIIRKKIGTSVDECARLCLREAAFDCLVMTYSTLNLECKWSSVLYSYDGFSNTNFISIREEYSLFLKDPLYDFIEYPYKIATNIDYKESIVTSSNECAYQCITNKKIRCRSFNYCQNPQDENTFKCLLSETNINSAENNPNIVFTSLCSHFSKKALNDFKPIYQKKFQLNAKSKLFNTSAERCAESCVSEDSFFCRSFDFFIDTESCFLYEENILDKLFIGIQLIDSATTTHYSRLYYEENGILKSIEPLYKQNNVNYSGGTIFGVVIAITISGLLVGVLSAFVYLKATKQSDLIPVMKFVNPNYAKSSDLE